MTEPVTAGTRVRAVRFGRRDRPVARARVPGPRPPTASEVTCRHAPPACPRPADPRGRPRRLLVRERRRPAGRMPRPRRRRRPRRAARRAPGGAPVGAVGGAVGGAVRARRRRPRPPLRRPARRRPPPTAGAPSAGASGSGSRSRRRSARRPAASSRRRVDGARTRAFTIHFDNEDNQAPHNVELKDTGGTEGHGRGRHAVLPGPGHARLPGPGAEGRHLHVLLRRSTPRRCSGPSRSSSGRPPRRGARREPMDVREQLCYSDAYARTVDARVERSTTAARRPWSSSTGPSSTRAAAASRPIAGCSSAPPTGGPGRSGRRARPAATSSTSSSRRRRPAGRGEIA